MYRILSLDGGGSWAVLQLLTLMEKYGDVKGHEVLRDYDLVIANSGGSIILTALAENLQLSKALNLFDMREKREEIFKKNRFRDRFFPVDYIRVFAPFGPKYSTPQKGKAFQRLFPQVDARQMSELPEFIGKKDLKLVVCTYDALNNRAKFFRSYGSERDDYDSARLTQAIHGSTNAPVQYFDFPARFKAKNTELYYELWDGALGGFNNPVVAGIIEALKQGVSLDELEVVSLGTGNKSMSMKDKKRFYEIKQCAQRRRRKKWQLTRLKDQLLYFTTTVLNQAKTILYEPPDWSNYVAMMFLKCGQTTRQMEERLVRLSPMIHIDENTPEEIVPLLEKLYELDMDLTTDEDVQLIKDCFEAWKLGMIANQPIDYKIKRDNELVVLAGDKTFGEAMTRWKRELDYA
jgi:patatin-like phospholipase/acyl hydrolase